MVQSIQRNSLDATVEAAVLAAFVSMTHLAYAQDSLWAISAGIAGFGYVVLKSNYPTNA